MSLSIADFWQLLAESGLVAPQQVQRLTVEFSRVEHSTPPKGQAAAQWLVNRKILSRYQALVLLAGRSGPFFYGEYRVVDRLEKGRFTGSFRAIHVPSGHSVLLHFLTGPEIADGQGWAGTVENVRRACELRSPHLQRYFELVDLGTFKFCVSEDLRGNSLDELLAKGRMTPAEACRVARLAALGLACMHQTGRTHGDVRPRNVFLESNKSAASNAKLLFEAHSKPGPIDFSQPASDELIARADFFAPELGVQGRAADPLSDVYALGAMLYTMLAGQPPFAGGDLKQKMARHAKEPIRPLESLGVPQPLFRLVAQLMAKNPAARIASITSAAEQLAAFAAAAHAPEASASSPSLANYEKLLLQKRAQPVAPAATSAAAMEEVASPIVIDATSASAPTVGVQLPGLGVRSADQILRRRKAQQKRRFAATMVVLCFLVAAMVAGGFFAWKNPQLRNELMAIVSPANKGAQIEPDNRVRNVVPAKPKGATGAAEPSPRGNEPTIAKENKKSLQVGGGGDVSLIQEIVPDNGKTLWASPTTSKPISFRCIPPEGQVFVVMRPADLLGNAEGERALAALGPEFQQARDAVESASGFKFAEIEQLHVTLHNNDAKFPRTSFVIRTREAFTPEQFVAKWDNPAPTKEQTQTYFVGPKWAFYIPDGAEDERTFAMGEARDIKEVAAAAGAPPVLFREIERLRRTTDASRHFTVVFYPQFFFNDDGEPLFGGERTKLKQPLAWLLGEHLQAVSLSAHLNEGFYFEMRMLASLDKEPYQLAEELSERLNKVPASLEDYFVSLNPPTYWKKLAFRYPGMVRELCAQTRIGVETDQAVVNAVLPAPAAHNLLLGGELLVATAPGQVVAATAAASSGGPKTIDDALQLKTSYSFDQQSLEFAMRDLAEDVKGNLKNASFDFAIKIIGDDLKVDGITRNQSIRDFRQENQTVADILTALVRKANPVTTVKDPSEKDQKLVWVIGPDPDNSAKSVVLITTRTAAAAKKYTLPPVFVTKK